MGKIFVFLIIIFVNLFVWKVCTLMTRAKVQGVLKNTDLLLDAAEIRSVIATLLKEKRVVNVRIGRDQTDYFASLIKSKDGKSIFITRLEPDSFNQQFVVGGEVHLYCQMSGYSLETTLTCLNNSKADSIRLSYPALFRVHSKRQISRFTTPLNLASFVEMVGDFGQAKGVLQDINLEGLSFLGSDVSGSFSTNEPVRLRLIPSAQGGDVMEMTAVLLFVGQDRQQPDSSSVSRYSVHITSVDDPSAFHEFFTKIKTSSHDLFRASVMSAESYRLIATI